MTKPELLTSVAGSFLATRKLILLLILSRSVAAESTIESVFQQTRGKHVGPRAIANERLEGLISRTLSSQSEDLRHRKQQEESTSASGMACLRARLQEQDVGSEFGTECDCVPHDSGEGYMALLCHDTECEYCTDDLSVCDQFSYGLVFDTSGEMSSFFEQDQYTKGKSDTLIYTSFGETCSMTINGQPCASCAFIDCDTGDDTIEDVFGTQIDCSNVPDGVDYSSCDETFSTDGVLQIYNPGDFEKCLKPAEDACLQELDILPSEYGCKCEPTGFSGKYVLRCMNPCYYCNEDSSICARDLLEKFYPPLDYSSDDSGIEIRESIQFLVGEVGKVQFEQHDCAEDAFFGSANCTACTVEVQGEECNSCTMKTCDSNGKEAPLIDCRNIDSGGVYDMCLGDEMVIENEKIAMFAKKPEGECVESSELACLETRAFYESSYGGEYVCSCSTSSDNATELTCQSSCGELCNDEATQCGQDGFVEIYESGEVTYYREEFTYTHGRSDVIHYEIYDEGSCSLSVNSVLCRSCAIRTCPNNTENTEALLLDCENIEEGAFIDQCESDTPTAENGVLEYFSEGEFDQCVNYVPASNLCSEGNAPLTPDGSTIFGSTMAATMDAIESCAGISNSPGVWYHVVGRGSGLTASTCNRQTDFDTQISVYEGSCNALTCVTGNDDSDCDIALGSSVAWFGEAGVTYYIRVHGHDSETGTFGLRLAETSATMVYCEEFKNSIYDSSDRDQICTCSSDGGEATLTCDHTCDDCTDELDICARRSQIWKINESKDVISTSETYQYIEGLSGQVSVETSNCTDAVCSECSISVDDDKCEFCQMEPCLDENGNVGRSGFRIGCGTVTGETELVNTCFPVHDGVFQVLSDSMSETCVMPSFEACEVFRERVRSSAADCECSPDSMNATLDCNETGCHYCNNDNSVCATRSFGKIFDENGVDVESYESHQYTTGREETLVLYKVPGGACSLTVDGEACSSCEYKACSYEDYAVSEMEFGYAIDCENIEDGASIDECALVIQSGVLQIFNSREFNECMDDDAYVKELCEAQAEVLEEDGDLQDKGTMCDCRRRSGDDEETYRLTCRDQDCLYCNTENSVCADKAYGIRYNQIGEEIGTFEAYRYAETTQDELVVLHTTDTTCNVTVEGVPCSSCELITCPANDQIVPFGNQALQIDCENVESGASFDGCSGIIYDGILQVFNEYEFDVCNADNVDVQQICEADLEAYEDEGYYEGKGTFCECRRSRDSMLHSLICQDTGCLFCNSETSVCADKTYGVKYDRFGHDMMTFESYQYIEDSRIENVVFESGESTCKVTVDGKECNHCEYITCEFEGENGLIEYQGLSIECENIEPGATFDDCGNVTIDTGIFEVASSSEFEVCHNATVSADQVCLQHLAREERSGDNVMCECSSMGSPEEDNVLLTCVKMDCLYCNLERKICGHDMFGFRINQFGEMMDEFQGFKYVEGAEQTVLYHDIKHPDGSFGCKVTVDDEECGTCEYVTCQENGSVGMEVSCDNLPGGANYNDCTPTVIEDGIFEFISESEFRQCVQLDDPAEACHDRKRTMEAEAMGALCECQEESDGRYNLFCRNDCKYCNADESICKIKGPYGGYFDRMGQLVSLYDYHQYVSGRDEAVYVDRDIYTSDCRVQIDGEECSSCELITCVDDITGSYGDYEVDCSNIAEGMTYRCGTGDAVFQALSPTSFGICTRDESISIGDGQQGGQGEPGKQGSVQAKAGSAAHASSLLAIAAIGILSLILLS